MNITKKWVTEHGCGHWVVSNGTYTVSCDEGDLRETIEELEQMGN